MAEDRISAPSGDFDPTRPSRHVLSGAMREPSEDSESDARVTTDEGEQTGSDDPDRPKLVALPEPTAESAPAADEIELAPPEAAPEPAREAGAADADRLALERSLSGPPLPSPRIAAAPSSALTTPRRHLPAHAHAYAPAFAYAPQSPAIAVTATPELVQALRAELAMRAHAEAGLRARAVDAETRLATRRAAVAADGRVAAPGPRRARSAGRATDRRARATAGRRAACRGA